MALRLPRLKISRVDKNSITQMRQNGTQACLVLISPLEAVLIKKVCQSLQDISQGCLMC